MKDFIRKLYLRLFNPIVVQIGNKTKLRFFLEIRDARTLPNLNYTLAIGFDKRGDWADVLENRNWN
jgi:hypothetical protein